jgi:hypothetical protein
MCLSGCTPREKPKGKSAKECKGTTQKCLLEADKKRNELIDKIKDGSSSLKVEGSEDFKTKTYKALDRLAQTETGRKLIESLDAGSKTTIIKETNSGNTEIAENWDDGLYDRSNKKPGTGSNTTVKFNPDTDKINEADWGTRDPAIGLGHELIHAYHDTNGTTDGRDFVEYNDGNGKKKKAPGYELQAVGLGEYKDNDFTENKLRKEFNDNQIGKFGKEAQRPHY